MKKIHIKTIKFCWYTKLVVFTIAMSLLPNLKIAAQTARTWTGLAGVGVLGFNTAANWNPSGTPGTGDDLTIGTVGVNRYPQITANSNCRNITISGNALLDFTGNGILNVYGNLNNTTGVPAATDGNAGTVNFRNTVNNNTITGSCNFFKLVVNKTAGNRVVIQASTTIHIASSLKLQAGNIDARLGTADLILDAFDDGGNWSTAYIDGTGAGDVEGQITVEQITYDNYKTYHFLCGPVLDSNETFWTTTQLHPFYDQTIINNTGYVYPGGTIPDFLYYDESIDAPGSGSGADGTYGYKGTNPQTGSSSTKVALGQGTCSKFKPFFTSGSPDPIKWTGIVNNGNIVVPLTYTNHHENGDGLNLIGNPYPSPIEWQKVYSDSGYFPVIWIWQNDGGELTGSFLVYDAADVPNSTFPDSEGRIAIGQGFTVVKDSLNTSSNFTWKNSYRATGIDPAFYREAPKISVKNAIDIRLGGLKNKDITLIHFGDYNSTDKKPIKNITKMMNPDNSLYTINQSNFINSLNLPFPSQETTIPLGITIAENGNYYLEASNINLSTSLYKAFLVDLKTKKIAEIDADFKYEFEATKGTDNDRFIIKVVNKETVANTPSSKEYALINNANLEFQLTEITNETVTANVTDASGKTIWSGNLILQNGRGQIKNDLLPNGLLFLNIVSATKNTTFKLINVN